MSFPGRVSGLLLFRVILECSLGGKQAVMPKEGSLGVLTAIGVTGVQIPLTDWF